MRFEQEPGRKKKSGLLKASLVAGGVLLTQLQGERGEAAEAQTAPISTLTHVSQENVSESAEASTPSWEGRLSQMSELALNETNEYIGMAVKDHSGTAHFSSLIEGEKRTTLLSHQGWEKFFLDSLKGKPIAVEFEHTHPVSNMSDITSVPRSAWERVPFFPPSLTDVSAPAARKSKIFSRYGISAKHVYFSVADASGGKWNYAHKRGDELTERERAREAEEVLAVQLDGESDQDTGGAIFQIKNDLYNSVMYKDVDLKRVISLLPSEMQTALYASESASVGFRALVGDSVHIYIGKEIEGDGPPSNPVVDAIAPQWRERYAAIIKASRSLRTFREERAQAEKMIVHFTEASISASFDFTKEYAELQKAYELLNAKVRYVTKEEAVREGPCVGVDVPRKEIAAR